MKIENLDHKLVQLLLSHQYYLNQVLSLLMSFLMWALSPTLSLSLTAF